MRSLPLLLLPLLPALLSAQEAWHETLGRTRGVLLLVEPQPGWVRLLRDPELEDLVSDLAVEATTQKDPSLERFSVTAPGAYLFNEAGRLVGSWRSGAPSDLRVAFAEVGWLSRVEELERQLKDQGARVDLHWRLVQEHWRRTQRRPSPDSLDRLAGALQRLFRRPGWCERPARPLPFFAPPPGLKEPLRLRELAKNHLEEVRELLRANPESPVAWEMLAFLSAWHPGEEPRIHRFLETLPPPPGRHEELLEWPGRGPCALAETQLRRLGDWAGLEEFAQKRLDQVYLTNLALAPEIPPLWASRLGFQDSWGRNPGPRATLPGLPFAREAARISGRWLLLLLEAQLAQDKSALASTTISLLLRDATESLCRDARRILLAAKAEALVRQLDSGMS